MPYRAGRALLGIVGLAVLVILLLLGVNVYRAGRTGSRWKRKLITAGLVFLGLMSSTSCGPWLTCYAAPPRPPVEETRRDFDDVSARLDILERQVANWELRPDTSREVLASIREEMRPMPDRERLKMLDEPEKGQLLRERKALEKRIARLEKKLGAK